MCVSPIAPQSQTEVAKIGEERPLSKRHGKRAVDTEDPSLACLTKGYSGSQENDTRGKEPTQDAQAAMQYHREQF